MVPFRDSAERFPADLPLLDNSATLSLSHSTKIAFTGSPGTGLLSLFGLGNGIWTTRNAGYHHTQASAQAVSINLSLSSHVDERLDSVTHCSYLLKWMRSTKSNSRPARMMRLSSHTESTIPVLFAGVSSSSASRDPIKRLRPHFSAAFVRQVVVDGGSQTAQRREIFM
jgi:hypothetical protein